MKKRFRLSVLGLAFVRTRFRKRSRRASTVTSILSVFLGLAGPLAAQTWNGGGGDDLWGTGANWVGGLAPATGTGTTINFAGSTRLTPDFNYTAFDQMGSIFFNAGAGAFTLSGSPIKISSKIENSGAVTQTISFGTALVLNGSTATEINPVSGNLIVNSPIILDTPQLQVWGNNGNTVTFNGMIANGTPAGGSFALKQNSRAVLRTANTFTGGVFVEAGMLRAETSVAALGAGGLTLAGGELQLANDTSLAFNRNTIVTGNAQITSDTLNAIAGVNHTLGTLSLGGQTLSIAKGSNATGSTAGVTFGAVTLTGSPTFSPGANSILTMGAVTGTDQNLTFVGSGAATVTGVIGTGAGSLNVNGGTVTVSNTGNTFTGAVTVDGPSSILATPGNNGTVTGDPTALGSGTKAINLINGGTIRLTSNANPTNTSAKMFTIGTGGGKIETPSGITVTLDDNTGATAQLLGTGNLTKLGTGLLQLGRSTQGTTGFNGYTGNIIISVGTVQAGHFDALGTGAGTTTTVLGGGALDFYSGATTIADDLIISGTGPIGAGALLNSSANTAVSSGTLALAANSTLGASAAGALTINGVVSGAFDLTKAGVGAGIVTLAHPANTYTGLTTISAGTLAGTTIANIGGGDTSFGNVTTGSGGTIALGSVGNAILRVNATVPATTDRVLDLAGTTFTGGVDSSGSAPVTFTGNVTVTGIGIKQFTLGGINANDNVFSGIITDGSAATGLAKTGTGTWVLPAANTFTGATVLTGGVLSITNNSALGTAAGGVTQSGGSELRLSGGIAVGLEPLSMIGGGITNFGALRNFSGNNSWGGPITLTGQSRINSDSGILTINNTITGSNFGLVVGGGGDVVLNNALSFGTGVFNKSDGTGTLTLNATSTHTGVTSVATGKLLLGPSGNLGGATAATVFNGATLAVGQNAIATTNTLGGSLTLAAGSVFTMADGFTSTLAVTGATTFGGTAASTLTFDLGGAVTATDRINSTGIAIISAAGETIGINPIGASPLTAGIYNLITGVSGSTLSTNPFSLSTTKINAGGTPYLLSLTSAATTVNLNVSAFAGLDTAYWKGDLGNAWNDLSSGSNWDTAEAGGVDANAIPTSVTDVFIHANGAGNLTMSPGQDFTVNSLNYTAASTASTIGSGNTLTLAAAGTGNIGINVASGAAAHTINANVVLGQNQTWNHAGANTLTVGGSISGPGSLTKTGTGTLALTSNYSGHTGGLAINGGKVSLTNNYNTAGGQILVGNTAGNGLLSIAGGTIGVSRSAVPGLSLGNGAGSNGAVNLSTGTLNVTSEAWLGTAAGGYGALTITGGTANIGSWLAMGRGGNAALNVGGGALNVLSNNITMGTVGGTGGNTNEVANFSGNSTTNVFGGGIFLPEQLSGHVAVVNISGSANVNLGTGVSFGQSATAAVNTGILNLNGGTLSTKSILKGGGTGTYLLNLNGGIVKAQPGATAGFLTGLSAAYINSGGVTFNTNGQNITVAQNLLAPTGSGVNSTGLILGGTNSGYVDTPVVSITGGGGIGATAVANLDYSTGVVTGITITNPGNGYTTAPSFSLIGGGGGATVGGSATLTVNNTSGGLIKTGPGTLDLTGANTYTGPTVVNAGGLNIGNTSATSAYTFASGTSLGFNNTVNLTMPQNFAVTTALTKNGGGFTTLTGTNSFGGINTLANGGGLIFNSAAALGPVNGRTILSSASVALNYATSLQNQLIGGINGLSVGSIGLSTFSDPTANLDFSAASGANQTNLHLGVANGQSVTYTGTITPNAGIYRLGGSGGTLTLSNTNALTGTNSLNMHGVGGSTTNLSATNDYSGGTTFVGNSATLSFANGSLGSGPISFTSPTPALQWATGNTQDITASRTVTFNSGSNANLNTNGNNVVFGNPIGNFGAGGLTKTGNGNLTLTGINTYTGNTGITGGTLTLANGARLNSTVTLTVANSLLLGGSTATIGGLAGSLGNSLPAGSILTIGANNSAQTYSGALAATTAGLTKIGAATQTLTGANLYTGATTIQMGNLTSGQLVASVLNLGVTGASNRIAPTSALVMGGNTATDAQTILGGGSLHFSAAASATASAQTFNGASFGVGNNTIAALNANATTPTGIVLGAITRNPGATLFFQQPAGTQATANSIRTTTGTASTLLTSAAGTAYAIMTAPTTAGTLNAMGAYGWAGKDSTNAWIEGVAYLTAGTSALYGTSTATSNTDVTAAYTALSDVTAGTLRFNNLAVVNTHNLGAFTTSVDKGGILFTGTAAQTISNGTLKPIGGNELVFINTNIATPVINATMADGAGPSSVTYRGLIGATGTSQFSVGGNNTYTGSTYLTSGRVQTGAVAQPFGTGAAARVFIDGNTNGQWFASGAAAVANPFLITGNGWSEASGPFGAIRMDSGVNLTGGVTLLGDASVGVNTGTGTISSQISGAFNLTKVAALNLNLTGTNTLTGKYVVAAGALTFGSAGAYGTATGLALTGGAAGLNNLTDIQTNIINRLTPLNAATPLNGTVGVSAATVAENVDFSSTGLDLSNVYFGAVAAGLTYTGTITPFNNAYRIGGGGNLMTFSNVNAFVDNGAIARSLTVRNNSVILTGTNSYTGGTTVLSGTMNFINGALGSGPVTMAGGTLAWAAGNTQDPTASGRAVTFTGASTLDVGANDVTLTGPLAFNTGGTVTKNGANTLTLSGVSTTNATTPAVTVGVGGLTLGTANALPLYTNLNIGTAAGVVTTITGNQTLGAIGVSGTFSSSSSLVLGAAGTTATVGTNNSNQTIDAVISGNANLLKVGNGTQFLRSLNPSFGGALEVNNGFTVLEFAQVAAASINIIPASTVVTLSGGGIQVLGNGTVGSTSNQTFTNAVVLKPGASSVGTAPRASQTTSLILTGGFNRQPGSTVNVLTNGGGASFIGNGVTPTSSITTNQSNADYTSGGGNQSILGGYAGFSSVVPTAAVLNPPTTWAVSANAASNTPITGLASFSSTFTAAANVDSALGNVSTGAAALTINSLRINNAGATTIDAAGGLNIASGGILVTAGVGNNPLSILNGALTSGNGTDLIVHQYAAGDLTISSQVAGNIGLTKSGAGRLILTNASNNYTGTTFVNTGVLRYGTSTTPGSTAALVHSGASIELTDGVTVTGQTATVSGTGVGANSVLFGANGNSTWAGNVVIGDIETRLGAANVATLNITGEISDGAPSNQVLNNKLWINGVTGTGAVVLSGTNTYTGTTAIIRGNLKLNSLNALPATTILDVHSGGNNVGLTTEQATIDLNGYSPTVSGLARTDTTGSGTITNFAAGTSTLTVNNPAANTFSGNIADGLGQIALVKSGAGSLTLSGSNTFSGGLIINNGTVTMGSQNAIGNQALPNALTLNGGLLNANSVAQISLAKLSGAAGTITDSGLAIGTTTLSTGSTTNEVFGGLIADGSVRNLSYIKGGSGTQSLTGANTYSGITVVTAGTLLVNNTTGSGTGTGTVVVSSGATLGGNGTIGTGLAGSTLRVNGTLAPGNSPGLLTSNQPVDFNIGSTFAVEANGSTLGSGYDQLVANSSVNISGTSVFQMTLGYAPALGDAFTFINLASGSIGGVFSNLPDNGFYTTTFAGNPYGFTTSYSGGTGNDLVLTTAVPEPGTIGILAAATLGMGLRRRRRQAGAVN